MMLAPKVTRTGDMTEQRALTAEDLTAMMHEIHEHQRENAAACEREGHHWNAWVELPPDRAGRICTRCGHIAMVRFADAR